MGRQVQNAQKVAEFLHKHPMVDFVNYPGLPSFRFYERAKTQMTNFNGEFSPGSLIYFTIKGKDAEDMRNNGRMLMNYAAKHAYTLTLAVSLGHTRTLIEHPASMTHSMIPVDKLLAADIHPGGIRLAIGLENNEDIIKDLEKCLSIFN